MAESAETLGTKNTAVLEKKAVKIPEFFLSPNSAEYFRIIVEGQCLHISKSHLGDLSKVWAVRLFNDGFDEAKNGEAEVKDQPLSSVLLFLCWAYDVPYPDSEGKKHYAIGDRNNGIAFGDISELMRLADFYQVEGLQRHCRQAYCDYVASCSGGWSKEQALEAVKVLEWVQMKGAGLDGSELGDIFSQFQDSFISVQDIQTLDLSPEFRYWLWEQSGDLQRCIGGYTDIQKQTIKNSVLSGIPNCHPDALGLAETSDLLPMEAADTLYSFLPEMQALAGLERGEAIPRHYRKLWATMPDQTQGPTCCDALLSAVSAKRLRDDRRQTRRAKGRKIDNSRAAIAKRRKKENFWRQTRILEIYCFLRPTLTGEETDADALIQLFILIPLEHGLIQNYKVDSVLPTLLESLFEEDDDGGSYNNMLVLATAFPHCYAVTSSSQPPQQSIGLPSADWAHVLSRGCVIVALMSKRQSADVDALIAYCAAFQTASSQYASPSPALMEDALGALRSTRDHALLYSEFTEEQRQSLRVSVNLGKLGGELNMVDKKGKLYTFAGIGALLNNAWQTLDRGRRSSWAPHILKAARDLVAECQAPNIDTIHNAAVA